MAGGGGIGQGRYTRPDASMSLLTNLMEHSLDEGYAEAAARRRARERPAGAGTEAPQAEAAALASAAEAPEASAPRRGGRRWPGRPAAGPRLVAAVGLCALALILTVAAVQTQATAPQTARERQALAAQVERDETRVDAQRQQLQQLQAQVDQDQNTLVANSDSALAARLSELQLLSGSTPVSGPGLVVTLDDAPAASPSGGGGPRASAAPSAGRIEDADLQQVVNGLWASGAEAIAVNGERLTVRTAIRTAGDTILVNFSPVTAPYTVSAIGDPNSLPAMFQQSTGGRYLAYLQQLYGIRASVTARQSVQLPAATALLDLSHASAAPTGTPSPSPGVSATPTAGPGGKRPGKGTTTRRPAASPPAPGSSTTSHGRGT